MKALVNQWTDGKSLKRLLSVIFGKGARLKQTPEPTPKTLPMTNMVSILETAEAATPSTSERQTSTREESSISTFGTKLLKRIKASRAGPKTDSPLRRLHSSPSGTALTDATSVSPPKLMNPGKCQTCSYESPASMIHSNETSIRAPLTARYPEIFIYMGRNGVPNSALALTKDMVKDLNEIFRLERQVNGHRRNIKRLDDEYECVIMALNELNRLLPSSGITNQSDRDAKLEELKYLSDVSSRIQGQRNELQQVFKREYGKLSEQRKAIFNMFKDVLRDRDLLDSVGKDTRPDQFYCMPTTQVVPLHEEPHIPTHSEEAQERAEQGQREAVYHMKEMGHRLQEAHQKLDSWRHYYDDEYADYARAEHQEATEEVIDAEDNYEKARGKVRELDVVLSDIYQSSGFANYPDDGYRVSMEEAMAGDVDREWILSWMEQIDKGVEIEGDGDEWEAKSIGFEDSVSVVAKGRERQRIDRWQKRCMAIENIYPGLPKVVGLESGFASKKTVDDMRVQYSG